MVLNHETFQLLPDQKLSLDFPHFGIAKDFSIILFPSPWCEFGVTPLINAILYTLEGDRGRRFYTRLFSPTLRVEDRSIQPHSGVYLMNVGCLSRIHV